MRNLIESLAVLLVGVLSAFIIYLIVQFNMIEDDNSIEEVAYIAPVKKKETVKSYLSDMEKYSDVDVQVDPTIDDRTNSVHVKSELVKDKPDHAKSSVKHPEKTETKVAPKVKKTEEPSIVKPDDSLGMDEFRNALDSIVNDKEEMPSTQASNEKDKNVDDGLRMAIDAALEDL